MTDKAHIWEYFGQDNSTVKDENDESNIQNKQSKRVKHLDRNYLSQDVTWIKSLLHPSMEKSFIRLEISSVVIVTKNRMILNIKPQKDLFPEFDSLLGFFDVWWWKKLLPKVEFIASQELSNNFPFLNRIMKNENIINRNEHFALLLSDHKLIRDDADGQKGLITCKRFLVVE